MRKLSFYIKEFTGKFFLFLNSLLAKLYSKFVYLSLSLGGCLFIVYFLMLQAKNENHLNWLILSVFLLFLTPVIKLIYRLNARIARALITPIEVSSKEDHYSSTVQNQQPEPSNNETNLFAGVSTMEELRERYHALIKLYHPDNKSGDQNITTLINEQYKKAMEAIK